jgi:hypothetical protein
MKLLSCRLLGIGRNQYIDLMNQTRSKTKFGGFSTSLFRKSYRDLLPSRPVSDLVILPWWVVQVWQHVKNAYVLCTMYQCSFRYKKKHLAPKC